MSYRTLVSAVVFILLLLAILWESGAHSDPETKAEEVESAVRRAPDVGEVADLEVKVGPHRTAILSGRVESRAERRAATEAALGVRGLLTVYNDLQVDELLEVLLVRLDALLEADPTEGEFEYRVSPDGHAVTLQGWVPEDEPDLRQSIEELVWKVPGVRQVHNNLGLGPPDDELDRVQERIFDILRLANIYFDYNKATIRQESLDSVRKIAEVLQEHPDVRVVVEGHTDSIASEQYNQELSEARAESVEAALVEYGVAPERIETIGYGELQPVAPNDTPEGRAENRRIEFEVRSAEEGDLDAGAGESQP